MANPDLQSLNTTSRRVLGNEIATRATDPLFYSGLEVLPNPDRILRKMGRAQDVYDDLVGDAHILGDLRSIRSALLGFEWRLELGASDRASRRAHELCQQLMRARPGPGLQWSDVIWSMAGAVFRGYAVHEVVWERQGDYILPARVLERPQRRFVFGNEANELRLLTRDNRVNGEMLGERKWLLTRHMPSSDNPYGTAVFSACFWPWVFKHSGMKYFVKFCERYGIPWAIGKYPPGTPSEQVTQLADNLQQMVEDACAAVPNDSSVELLQASANGKTVHQDLVYICNRELSKALTSQTLASDQTDTGARAAAETHRGREESVNESDRAIIEYSMCELLEWVTAINVDGATPPRFVFWEEAEARKDMADALLAARRLVPLSRREVYERLQLTEPESEEDTIPVMVAPVPAAPGGNLGAPGLAEFSRACKHCGAADFAAAADDPMAKIIAAATEMADKPVGELPDAARRLLDEVEATGGSLGDFQARLPELWEGMDVTDVTRATELAMMVAYLSGMEAV